MDVYYFTTEVVLFIAVVVILIIIAYKSWNGNKTYNTDSFGRLRVSQPFTLGDYKHYYGITDDMLQKTENGGTATHNTNEASVKLAVTTTNGSRVVHQSKMYHHYMPGKSQFILSSFVFFNPVPGIVKRTGYFDDRDGLFFEQGKDGEYYFVVRSYTSGTAIDTKIEKKDWNGDKIDLDFSKTQLLWMDFQWLGVGRVRFGFVHKDDYILCHTVYNSNNLDKVYINNPNLPVRCEILNSEATEATFMNQICSTVASEGGYSEAGKDYSYITDNIEASVAEDDEIAIRLANVYQGKLNRTFIRLSDIKVFADSDDIIYKLYKVDSFTGGTKQTLTDYNGAAEIYIKPDTTTNKTLIGTGVVPANSQGNKSYGSLGNTKPGDAKKNFISQNFDSTGSEAFVVSIQRIGTGTDFRISLDWREVY